MTRLSLSIQISRLWVLCTAIAIVAVTATPLRADSSAAPPTPVHGTVVDGSGGVIAGATVILDLSTAPVRQTRSDAAGRFAFDTVPADASGTVTVVFDRFSPVTVDLASGRALRIVLEPLPVSEQITVRAPRLTVPHTTSATRTDTSLVNVPQAITVVTKDLIADQAMQSMADVVQYVPGVGMAQGEGHRDAPIFRGNISTSDFYVDGVRDDTQYLRDLYNVERVEALKGPNAMIFGRGGVGGVINRVSRRADWASSRELTVQAGSFGGRRLTGDVGQAVSRNVAVRLTGLFEDSDTYRDDVHLERVGVNPTIAVAMGPNTTLRAGYEYFHDDRTTDRGVPSYQGRPVGTDARTFFGNPELSTATATVNTVHAAIDHRLGTTATLRSRVSYAVYDKFYQNVFAGAVDATGTSVSLSAYHDGTGRRNLFSQTELVVSAQTGALHHTLVGGVEVGRQETDNFRATGYFSSLGPNVTSVSVPVASPRTSLPMTFRATPANANNHGVATTAAAYVQDQVALSRHVQAVAGVRLDRFAVDFLNHRTAERFETEDLLVSPRVGVIYKPREPVSFYASYTLSYLPRAGEQLTSLTLSNHALDPEKFRNYEVGAKWDLRPALSFSAALYRLDRGNVVVPDPLDPGLALLVDAQRTRGVELELTGSLTSRWSMMGGYAFQDGEITQSISSTALAGARLAQLPAHAFSMWNRYDLSSRVGVGLGLIRRGDMFTSTDNTVVLPGYTRVDLAGFFKLSARVRAQANIENLLDRRYFLNAHNNNNIMPGSPVALRVGLTTLF
jgi:catecholate siderophore receptor